MFNLNEKLMKQLNVIQQYDHFHGGQKEVFVVDCQDIGKCVVKVFQRHSIRDIREKDFYAKFEGQKGIPKILSTHDLDGQLILIEEYINGYTLRQKIDDYKDDYTKIKQLITDIANIMDPLWTCDSKIVHRDLKPENIMIKPDNKPVIIDFGIHKDADNISITASDEQPKTVAYAAPEQLSSEYGKITHRTDFYSIGVIAYELFIGKLLFTNKVSERIEQLKNPVTLPDTPLQNFLQKTLEIEQTMRPKNTTILLELL